MLLRNIVFSLGAILFSLSGQTSGAQSDPETVALCAELKRLGGNVESLANKLADSIHYNHFCDDGGECYSPASKRIDDYSLLIVAPTGVDVGKPLTNSILSSLSKLNEVTEKHAQLKTPETLDFLALVFVDEADSTGEHNATIENIIAPENLEFSETRRKIFSNWLESNLICNEITTEYDIGAIQDAQIWLKLGYSDENTFSCVEAAMMKSMGLKKLEDARYNKGDFGNSWLDANSLGLTVLYSDLVKPGQSRAQTKLRLKDVVENSCQ